jgi:sugar lactone lactonase YvrE
MAIFNESAAIAFAGKSRFLKHSARLSRWVAMAMFAVGSMASLGSRAQTIDTVAGTGVAGYSGDGGAATSAQLEYPSDVVFDAAGNLIIVDWYNHRIRRVTPDGIITTIAGGGTNGLGDGGPATSAKLYFPFGVAVDGDGNLAIADNRNNLIRRVDAETGIITTIAGMKDTYGCSGYRGDNGDGGAATSAGLCYPNAVAFDAAGNLVIADSGAHRIRRVDAVTGIITTIAGTGVPGYSRDGGAATSARLYSPTDVTFDSNGNLVIADYGTDRIRRVDAVTGIIATIAGTGIPGFSGDGQLATRARLLHPAGVAFDAAGNLAIADFYNQRIRRVDAVTGIITTIAGTGVYGYSGDGGAATSAQLYFPSGVAFDAAGNLAIADENNHRIRTVTADDTTGAD